jgi:hypothetical protein
VIFDSITVGSISPTRTLAAEAPAKCIDRDLVPLSPTRNRGQLERCTKAAIPPPKIEIFCIFASPIGADSYQ